MGKTVEVSISKFIDVDVEFDLGEFDTSDLIAELQSRSDGDEPERIGLLRRIVWEHDILGTPLEDVIDDMMHEYRIVRGCASGAVLESS